MENNFGKNLLLLRKQNNLTHLLLAAKIGVSGSMIGKWERGENEPTLTHILKIMKIFSVSFDELME